MAWPRCGCRGRGRLWCSLDEIAHRLGVRLAPVCDRHEAWITR